MKRHLVLIGLAGSFWLGTLPLRAELEVSASVSIRAHADFYEPLTPHGAWVEVGSYGRCWRPARVAVGWRPYCEGHWVWTDCGWYWVSDEPWAWACYHYGSWVYDSHHSWIWVPGVEWAPAWVSWRSGGGYIGWAPMPPPHVHLAPTFVFVETRRFREPVRRSTVVVNNTTIINQTKVVSNVRREQRTVAGRAQKVVINEGPGVEVVQKASGQQVRATPIQEAAQRTSVPAAVERRSRENKGKDQPAAGVGTDRDRDRSAPAERKSPPAGANDDKPGVPGKPVPPNQPAQPDRPDKPDKPEQPDKPDKPNRPDKPDKPDQPDRPEQPAQPAQPGRPDKPDHVNPPKPEVPPKEDVNPRRDGPPNPPQPPPPSQKRPPGKPKKEPKEGGGQGPGKDR